MYAFFLQSILLISHEFSLFSPKYHLFSFAISFLLRYWHYTTMSHCTAPQLLVCLIRASYTIHHVHHHSYVCFRMVIWLQVIFRPIGLWFAQHTWDSQSILFIYLLLCISRYLNIFFSVTLRKSAHFPGIGDLGFCPYSFPHLWSFSVCLCKHTIQYQVASNGSFYNYDMYVFLLK